MNESNVRLTKQDVKNMFSPAVYRRGETYYNEGRVSNLKFDSADRTWWAEVSGSYVYEASVQQQANHYSIWCDCPAFESYGECKHIVAVMLAMCDPAYDRYVLPTENTPPTNQKYRVTGDIIHAFAHKWDNTDKAELDNNRQQLGVEYTLKTFRLPTTFYGSSDDVITIELKVGLQRPYVVKDLRKFLDSVKQQSAHYFTKRFTYDPTVHCFSAEDRDVIDVLQHIYRNDALYRRYTSSYMYGSSSTDRMLIVPPIVADELLQALKDRNCRFEHFGDAYPSLHVEERPHEFSFQLDKTDTDEFKLDLYDFLSTTYLELYGWAFRDGRLYPVPPEQQAIIKELADLSDKSNTDRYLPIAKEQISPFLSVVVPVLKSLGELEMTEHVFDQIIRPPLRAKVYIADEGSELQVNIEYHYGETVIHPFSLNERDTTDDGLILIRDMEKEQAIMQIIENSPLKIKGHRLHMKKTDDALYDFLYRVLTELAELAEIYTSDAVKSLMLPQQHRPVTLLDLDTGGNWLEVSFNMEGIDPEHIQHILNSVVEKKKYYRLPSGAFVSLEQEQFQMIGQLLEETGAPAAQLASHSLQLPLYRGLQVDEIVNSGAKNTTKYSKPFRRFVQHLKQPEELDFTLPTALNATLRDYQTTGFSWLKTLAHYRLGGILADDMGLGKTVQAIAYMLSEKKDGEAHDPFLVVAPASLIYNWQNELATFAPELNVVVVTGTPGERRQLLERADKPDVFITSYPLIRQDTEQYEAQPFAGLILDEAQMVKNHQTKTFAAVQKIKAAKRFALSGTPIENSLDELWSIFHVIMPGFFPDHVSFRQLAPERVSKMVRPFILRRVKKDVLQELPDKIETVHLLELTKEQKELYLGYLEKTRQDTIQSLQQDGFHKNRMKILAAITRLRQICCHPSLFLDHYNGKSGKLEQLLELATTAVTGGKRLLIFSQFTSMLEMIRERLTREKLDTFYLDGQTPAKQRVEMTEAFNKGDKDAFLISLKAGGTGLNLTGADTVFLYDLWWNPAVEEQAAGRAHRIGQKNVVHVVRLVTRGTIEEKIYELQQKKKELIDQVIQPGETMLTSLTEAEIRDILSI